MSFLDSALSAFSDLTSSIGNVADVAAPVISSAADVASGGLPIGAMISGGATLLGSMMNNNTAISLANQQQAFSASQAASIYQRGAADLAAAGINPVIAYSSPASMASYSQPNIQPSLSLAANAFNNANEVNANVANKQANTGLTSAQTVNTNTDTGLKTAQTGATSAQTAKTQMDTIKSLEETKKTQIEQQLVSQQITIGTVQKAVMEADIFLKDASSQNQLSAAERNRAETALTKLQTQLKNPQLMSVLEHPDVHQAAATAEAASQIGQPLFDLLSSIKPKITVINPRK